MRRLPSFYQRRGKRLLDLAITIPALLLLSPVLALVGLLVYVRLGVPILLRQQRPGLHGEPYTLHEFRTMTDERDEQGNLLPDAERLTPLGRLLRASSLDELPELVDVVKGDMSLVGPRPLRMRYLELCTPTEARRHDVLPGITGWAQVQGRNAVSWDERLQMDVWYADNQHLWLDLRILWATIWVVLTRRGVFSPGHVTMPGLDVVRSGHKLTEHG